MAAQGMPRPPGEGRCRASRRDEARPLGVGGDGGRSDAYADDDAARRHRPLRTSPRALVPRARRFLLAPGRARGGVCPRKPAQPPPRPACRPRHGRQPAATSGDGGSSVGTYVREGKEGFGRNELAPRKHGKRRNWGPPSRTPQGHHRVTARRSGPANRPHPLHHRARELRRTGMTAQVRGLDSCPHSPKRRVVYRP